MTKPNNSWEIEFDKFKDLIKTISVGQYNEKGVNIGYKQADMVIKDFITKTLQQQREVNKDNLLNISMMIETVLGYLEMGNTKQAIKHLEVTQSMCYSDEELKLLQSLKQENK